MLHPATELRLVSRTIGYGVFATAPIPAGTLTWVLDPLDQVLDAMQVKALDRRAAELLEKYSWVIASGERILCWDFCRFMNHSCVPNCITASVDIEIAVRDIEVGEQLTNDYVTLNLERPFACTCGQQACRRRVHPDDIEVLAAAYDRHVADALRLAPGVDQPLLPWVRSHDELCRLTDGRRPPSILTRRFRPRSTPAMTDKSS